MEECDISNTDKTGALLHNYMEGTTRVILDGVLEEMLLNIYPQKYCDKVVIKRVKKFIYAALKHELYREITRSLLLFRNLSRIMKSWDFHTNP